MKLKNYDTDTRAKCECGCEDFSEVEKGYVWKCNKCKQVRAYMEAKV